MHPGRITSPFCTNLLQPILAIVLWMILLALVSGCTPWTETVTLTEIITPTITSAPLPDLVILTAQVVISSDIQCFDPANDLRLQVQIQNQGEADAGPIILSVNDASQELPKGLSRGESLTLNFANYQEETTIRIDPQNQILETDERNNLITLRLPAPALPAVCLVTPTPVPMLLDPVSTLIGHTGKVLSVAFSPDGNILASGSVDNNLRLWRVKQGTILRIMEGHPFPVLVVEFSPDGALLATGSTDGIIRTWRVSNGLLGQTFRDQAGRILDLKFSPDGKNLASSAEDFTVRIWDLFNGRLTRTIDEGMSQVTELAYTPDGAILAWAENDGSLRLWKAADQTWMNIIREKSSPATSIAVSPNGLWFVAGYRDGSLHIRTIADGKVLVSLTGHIDAITDLAISPDGRWIASSSKSGEIYLWPVQTQESDSSQDGSLAITIPTYPSYSLSGHSERVNSLAFSPKGDLLASCSDDKTIRLWSVPDN